MYHPSITIMVMMVKIIMITATMIMVNHYQEPLSSWGSFLLSYEESNSVIPIEREEMRPETLISLPESFD